MPVENAKLLLRLFYQPMAAMSAILDEGSLLFASMAVLAVSLLMPHWLPFSFYTPLLLLAVIYRSEEHTSELQSQSNIVCRLLLAKKQTIRPRTRRDCSAAATRPIRSTPTSSCAPSGSCRPTAPPPRSRTARPLKLSRSPPLTGLM